MTPEEAQDAIDMVTQGVEKFAKSQDYEVRPGSCFPAPTEWLTLCTGCGLQKMSQFVKESCDKKFGPTWHCCIGEGFSFDVTTQQKHSLYMMYAGYLGIMLWKC